jgi:hypothetical protein
MKFEQKKKSLLRNAIDSAAVMEENLPIVCNQNQKRNRSKQRHVRRINPLVDRSVLEEE